MGEEAFPSHVPVMLSDVMEFLECRSGGFYVDGTVGGGGYAEAILKATEPDGFLLGLDWDVEAVERARLRLCGYEERFLLERASFSDLPNVLSKNNLAQADGMVADLGTSSFQLDNPLRGFSFLQDGPLDMRMNLDSPVTAADLVNSLPEGELAQVIYRLGEEKWSRRIARAIVLRRGEHPFTRTRELSEVISHVVPRTRDTRRIHPATRTFQALRIAVNGELDALQGFLAGALSFLKPGGRLCIVAFHSLEDRIVKDQFRDWARSCRCAPSVLRCQCEGKALVRLLTRKAKRPCDEEVGWNPRARSARLRAVEKL